MLDPRSLRQDLDAVARNLARRGFVLDRELYKALESERKTLQVEVETLRRERNERSKTIGRAKAAGDDVESLKRAVGDLGAALGPAKRGSASSPSSSKRFSPACRICCTRAFPTAATMPPTSKCAAGASRARSLSGRDHVALGETLGLMDFDAAAKLAGSRFVVLAGALARLHRADSVDARRAHARARL